MKYLKVRTNRNLEIDPEAGIVFPIKKGTLLGMNLNGSSITQGKKALLKILPVGKSLLLPFTHFHIPHRGRDYAVFMTEQKNDELNLYAAFELKDRMKILTQIQNRQLRSPKTKILKVSIHPGSANRKLIGLKEIEPLF